MTTPDRTSAIGGETPASEDREALRERVARAICDFEWDGSQPSFDRKPPAFHARYLAWADFVLAALPTPEGG